MEKKKSGVTKRTWDKNVRKFATASASAWRELNAFVDSHCKRRPKKVKETFMDELCAVVDKYIMLNAELHDWCHKHKVDLEAFVCDVINLDSSNL